MDNQDPELTPEVGEDDLTLRQATDEVPCAVKTLRRAIHKGELPTRYALGPNGPQLIVTRPELEHWRAVRDDPSRPPLTLDTPLDKDVSHGQVDTPQPTLSMVSTLQAAIDQAVRSAVVPLVDELHATRTELGDTREQLGAARERVASWRPSSPHDKRRRNGARAGCA